MTTLTRQLTIPPEWAGTRFDKVATELLDEFSRVEITRWIREGSLTLDGDASLPKNKVKGGESILLQAERTEREAWQEPQALEFEIVEENDDFLVINKPPGLVVHPGAGNHSGTLVNGLLHHRPSLSKLPRAGIVHRLDKDTSGLMVVAANLATHRTLVETVAARTMHRQYFALCEGRMIAGQDIELAIGRDPRSRTRQAVLQEGKYAFTEVRVEERFRIHTLVRAKLSTGRTHQIRVHLSHVGFPLVGDSRYGARRKLPTGADEVLREQLRGFPRQALHAQELGFPHPRDQRWMQYSAAMPADMTDVIKSLRADVEIDGS
jgi:23S rRNA pseudouridine1911/1915/1917 synthase